MSHYSKEDLDQYRHRTMSVLRRIACGAHLKHCAECARRLQELEADDQFVAEIQDSVQAYESIPDAAVAKTTPQTTQ